MDNRGAKEKELVEALQKGKKEVLSILYDAYAPVMLGVILKIVKDTERAEEVLQDTFVAIWSRIGVYDVSRGRFLTWGLAIARGIALQHLKSRKYMPETAATTGKPANLQNAAQSITANTQACHLAPELQAVLDLVYLQGKKSAEAAAALGLTEEELCARLRQAIQQLKAEKST